MRSHVEAEEAPSANVELTFSPAAHCHQPEAFPDAQNASQDRDKTSAAFSSASASPTLNSVFGTVSMMRLNAADDVDGDDRDAIDDGVHRFVVKCKCRWRVRRGPSLGADHVGSVANGTFIIGSIASVPMPRGCRESPPWLRIHRLEAPDPSRMPDFIEIGNHNVFAANSPIFCLRRNKQGQGLFEVGVETISKPLSVLPQDFWVQAQAQPFYEDSQDCSLTWKLLGAVDSVVQFFSSLGPPNETGKSELSRNLAAPKKCRPNLLFENRQREQVKQAAQGLECIVKRLASATGGANANVATKGLAPEVRSRFARLRLSLVDFRLDGGRVQSKFSCEALAADLEYFIEICLCLMQTGGRDMCCELRQEFISFSQKHTQDLENHCITVRRHAAARSEERNQAGPRITLLKERFQVAKQELLNESAPPMLKPPPQPASTVSIKL